MKRSSQKQSVLPRGHLDFSRRCPHFFSLPSCVCVCVLFFSSFFLLAFIQLCSIFQPLSLSLSLSPADFRLSYPRNSKEKSLKENQKKKKPLKLLSVRVLLSFPGVIVFFICFFDDLADFEATYFLVITFLLSKKKKINL